jgi:hypothetical protein
MHGAHGLTGTHVPLPVGARPIRQTPKRTGFDWPTTTPEPDPDAIARLEAAKVVTVTTEKRAGRTVKIVRRRTKSTRTGRVDHARVEADYLAGFTTRQVAERHQCTQQYVSEILRQRGVETRRGGDARRKST